VSAPIQAAALPPDRESVDEGHGKRQSRRIRREQEQRHIVSDTSGHLIGLVVQDRNRAVAVLGSIPFAGSVPGCDTSSPTLATSATNRAMPRPGLGRWTVQIIRRSDIAQGFEILPHRDEDLSLRCRLTAIAARKALYCRKTTPQHRPWIFWRESGEAGPACP
jgi:hypothetical protein